MTRTIIPVSSSDPKTRLSPVLSANERQEFMRAMLTDVIEALTLEGHTPEVISTAPIDCSVPTLVDERPLNPLINSLLSEGDLAVIMADLPLITSESVARLFEPDADVVIAPGMGGGTNAIICHHPEFQVNYHDASIRDHRRITREVGANLSEVDSRQLATDIDEPSDLAEVLLHGDGAAADWLEDAGFELSVGNGRVGVTRV